MAILMSLYNIWCDKILDGSKPLEFRNNIGKQFKPGEIIYLYETSKNNGRKKVVGEVKIKDIKEIPKSKCGCYGFLPYFAENIIADKEIKDAIMYAYNFDLPNYDGIFKMKWMFLPKHLEHFKETGEFPNFFLMEEEELDDYEKKSSAAQSVLEECDNWLDSMGYYNEFYESYYKNYIEVETPIRYTTPLNLEDFVNLKDEKITKAPQSWCYVKERKAI